jgi:hypothetical protein
LTITVSTFEISAAQDDRAHRIDDRSDVDRVAVNDHEVGLLAGRDGPVRSAMPATFAPSSVASGAPGGFVLGRAQFDAQTLIEQAPRPRGRGRRSTGLHS